MAAQQANPGTDAYSMAELMVCEMARNLAVDDGTIGGAGAGAVLAMAANRLAVLTVAPNIWWFCGGSGSWNPIFSELPLTSADPRAAVGAEATNTMMQTVDMAMIGKVWGYGFNGGMQVDKYGNCNMIGIGPYENLKVRGPGSVGTIWTATISKYYLYFWHHNRRVVVDKVDYISSPGFLDGGETRWKYYHRESKGPALVYTPLCVMDFEETTKRLRLRSINPGYTVEDAIANTGCELVIPREVPTTKAPSETELFILRTQVDRTRVLKDYRLTIG